MLSRIRSLFIGASASSASPNSTSNYEFNETSIPVFDDNEYNAEAALVNSSGMEVIHTLNTDNIKSSEPKAGITESKDLTCKGTGLVTLMENSLAKGIIDGRYYFRLDMFENLISQGLTRGKLVDYEAILRDDEINWEVTSMKFHLTEEELEKEEMRRFKTIIGTVIHFNEEEKLVSLKYGKTQDEIQEIPFESLPKDYDVIKGDFLKVTLEASSDINEEDCIGKVISVEPSMKKTIVGKVTLNKQQQFSVDNHIYFENGVFHGGHRLPRPHDVVRVVAVESKFEPRFNWRAISVHPSKFDAYTARTKQEEGWLEKENNWNLPLKELLDNKCGVIITPSKLVNFGAIRMGSRTEVPVEIKNIGQSTVFLKAIKIQGDQSVCKFDIRLLVPKECDEIITVLQPETAYEVMISCTPVQLGSTRELCVFEFNTFCIGRHLAVIALSNQDRIISRLNNIENSGRREKRDIDEIITEAIEDRRKETVSVSAQFIRAPFFQVRRIDNKPVPQILWDIVKKADEALLLKNYPSVGKDLKIETYQDKFAVGLWLEEIQNEIIRRQYDLNNVMLERAGEFFRFEVPGLRDIHPPIQIGDPVTIHDHNETKKKYTSCIQDIRGNHIYIKFEGRDESASKNLVTIQFSLSRTTYKRAHHAVDQCVKYLGEDWLFPQESITVKQPKIPFYEEDLEVEDEDEPEKIAENEELEKNHSTQEPVQGPSTSKPHEKRFFPVQKQKLPKIPESSYGLGNSRKTSHRLKSIHRFVSDTKAPVDLKQEGICLTWFNNSLNKEQKDAVRRILRGQARPLPYIIYGPPGTGKTVTVVEAVMQVYKMDPNSRILVVAPSNSAADVIAEHLVKSKQFLPGEFVRLVGFLRQEIQIPDSIRDYCHDGEHLETIARHKLIVSTCTTAGQFVALGLDNAGHFTHVFIDEAGYCTEPEAMISATLCALSKEGQVILAGDPKQLGPVLMSDVAAKTGLALSLLERLMSLPLYSRNTTKFPEEKYNPVVLTKLVKNYRAHKTLLKLPSALFYDDELEPAAAENEVNLSHSLQMLGKSTGVPILFHGVQGRSEREDDSPSWYNKAEIVQVLNYVRDLRNFGLSNDDIGIITPYRKQVEKMRRALELGLLQDEVPKVGSVEEFQGSERKVMIMSLVRSVPQSMADKIVDRMSFIFSAKRFNVAITRAKALLIVVGNPFIITHDNNWNTFLKYCLELNCYVGCDLPTELDEKTPLFLAALATTTTTSEQQDDGSWFGRNRNSRLNYDIGTSGDDKHDWDLE